MRNEALLAVPRRVPSAADASYCVQPTLPLEGALAGERWHAQSPLPARPGRAAGQVFAFHRAFDLPRRHRPDLDGVPDDLLRLRARLLDEETSEFVVACQHRDLVSIADALADVVYVAYGTAATLGIDLDLVIDEVHRANMSKLDGDGRPVLRADGKVMKSTRYSAPDVSAVLDRQPPLPF